ncbi:cell division protein FtsN [Legionella massiliensis]|uniref:Cell division protein FtsN n=1 Tax=Legionella massiliensis TaxID=1034943 RepID=A0A078KXH7_9GAMM|nr:SPOR domain-containing protein [Legionella massiliensis]CDZ77691.1 cell division protein FtsN [Legionella massiliensis]CEE13429.1 cell division protein FtsN [Legionella massiliensis]
MAKDYGKRKPTRQKSSMPKQLFWLLASFLSGYLAATVFDFTSLSSWVNANILAKHKGTKPEAQVAVKEPELPKPKFEFYTLLAKDRSAPAQPKPAPVAQQVKPQAPQQPVAPAQQATVPATTPAQQAANAVVVTESKPVAVANTSRESYLIQIAAFKARSDAEHLKAALTLKGFDVSVVATVQQQVSWYRVIVGPFGSRPAAEKAQLNLAQNERIKGMIRKIDV